MQNWLWFWQHYFLVCQIHDSHAPISLPKKSPKVTSCPKSIPFKKHGLIKTSYLWNITITLGLRNSMQLSLKSRLFLRWSLKCSSCSVLSFDVHYNTIFWTHHRVRLWREKPPHMCHATDPQGSPQVTPSDYVWVSFFLSSSKVHSLSFTYLETQKSPSSLNIEIQSSNIIGENVKWYSHCEVQCDNVLQS